MVPLGKALDAVLHGAALGHGGQDAINKVFGMWQFPMLVVAQ